MSEQLDPQQDNTAQNDIARNDIARNDTAQNDTAEPDALRPSRARRWTQFGTRTVLLAMAAFSLLLFSWRTAIRPYQIQREVAAQLSEEGAELRTRAGGIEALRRWDEELFMDVYFVDITECGDSEAALASLLRLPHVETVVVGGPPLKAPHLRALQQLESLQHVVLDSTLLDQDVVDSFQLARPDVEVQVSHRKLMKAIANSNGSWKVFPKSKFASQDLRVMAAAGVLDGEHFEQLREIDMRGRAMDDPTLAAIAKATTLHALRFGYSEPPGLVGRLNGLTELRFLGISNTLATDDELSVLRNFKRLRSLELGRNVTDRGLRHVRGLRVLRYLDLSAAQVSDEGVEELAGLPQLRTVNLEARPITNRGITVLAELPRIEQLYLRNCRELERSAFDVLRKSTNLSLLDVRGTKLQQTHADALRKSLPKCELLLQY